MRGNVVAIDFETYYTGKYSVQKLGHYAYTHHPDFDPYLVAAHDGIDTIVCHPKDFPWSDLAGKVIVSHYADFDIGVYERLVELGTVPRAAFSDWLCTSAVCGYFQYPRALKDAARVVLGVEHSKEKRASACGKRGDTLFTDPEMLEYAGKDAQLCWQLWQKLGHAWPMRERDLWKWTRETGARGVFLDEAYVRESADKLAQMLCSIDALIPWQPVLSIPKFRQACIDAGITPPKSTSAKDEYFDRWLQENLTNDAPAWVRHMQTRRSLNRTLKVLQAMLARRTPNGRMDFSLRYCGADTGRWSGGQGLNMQNFNRGTVGGVDLRACLTAAPGKTFVIPDLSQIEARVALWFARDWKILELIASGMDLYEAHARATMGYADPRPMKDVDKHGRQMAKARCLGLSFGCGADKFVIVAKIMGGLDLSFPEAQKAVFDYRRTNPGIVGMWRMLDDKLTEKAGGDWLLPLPRNKVEPDNRRWLIYRKIDSIDQTAEVSGRRVPVYGGLLFENLVQATARDALADIQLRCIAAGHVPVWTVHDELVFEIPIGEAETKAAEIKAIFEQPLAWAPGLPLACEVTMSPFYCK